MEHDADLVRRLQDGDESAFVELVDRYQLQLLRLAHATVGNRAVAEEVTQDTWLAVIRGIERFEGRSSLRTWLYRVLLNRARSAAGKERRAGRADDHLEERFGRDGHWDTPPVEWADQVDDAVVAAELARRVQVLLPRLPDSQRQVVILHDVEHLEPDEINSMLGITDGNQRVLLHRARTRLRAMLAAEMGAPRCALGADGSTAPRPGVAVTTHVPTWVRHSI
jgi:RNA polymerase sigma-70 factor, ECF subfamily